VLKLAESVIKGKPGIKLEGKQKLKKAPAVVGRLKIVPYTVQSSFLRRHKRKRNVPGLYDGPFPWENMFGFPPSRA